MKILLSLIILCTLVALSYGECFLKHLQPGTQDGCIDPYDKSEHPFGSKWNTAKCMECSCNPDILQCCTTYGGVVSVPGCAAVVDPKTCKYKFYKADDPSKPCFKL
ncbi:small serum protein 2-like [Eublepharis macularius]|uniref:Small serum protein 2-like n=1 Tax=Eublepharis macularius TaxID=481883 RepID=A0AA97KDX3_EUBMA|nr:small serum protein 2-like [Eublepharis macularius]